MIRAMKIIPKQFITKEVISVRPFQSSIVRSLKSSLINLQISLRHETYYIN